MLRRDVLKGMAAAGAVGAVGTRERRRAGRDQDRRVPLAGRRLPDGRSAGARGREALHALNGDRVAGKKIELIVRDDTGVPDVARRIVQEMIVNEKVNIVLGGITPTALGLSQLATQAKIPIVVIISGASSRSTARPT